MDEFLSESVSDNKAPNEAIGNSLYISHNFTSPFAYPAMTQLLKTEAAYRIPPGEQEVPKFQFRIVQSQS